MKNLGTMDIFKPEYGDCSNGGISSLYNKVKVWEGFDLNAPDNAVIVIEDTIAGEQRIRAIPANEATGQSAMFGGTIIYTSNSLVPYADTPIKLYDRFEN